MSTVRTRFAPSPTGFLHVGGLRTALYCFLFAKKHGGSFILRIEDTDQKREVQGAEQVIYDDLAWAGIAYSEGPDKGGDYGPYVQSERLTLYHEYAKKLVEDGHAYYCFCSPERLEKVRERQVSLKQPPAYDRHCRDLSAQEVAHKLVNHEPHVIRMKLPLDGECTFTDLIRGQITINYHALDDQVLIKSDGFPTYHLAVVVDDHLMKISHVIRGEEWLPSTPKHLLLYKFFGWQAPQFAHLPLLLNPDRSKLSKRQGDVAVGDYREKGYLPEALVNFIALLGWNPGDTREIFSLDELVQEFSLERVGKAGAVFDLEKLRWMNQQYIMHSSTERLLELTRPLFKAKGYTADDAYLAQIIGLMKDRAIVLPDFVDLTWFLFSAPTHYDEQDTKKCWKPETKDLLTALAKQYETLEPFDAKHTQDVLRAYATSLGKGAGALLAPLRLALTGSLQGPSIFHVIELIGKQETLKRIASALQKL